MSQAVAPRATSAGIGPRPVPAEASRAEAPQRRAAAATVVIGALATMATLALAGLLLTHKLAHGTVGHWDEVSTRWLATHRDSGLDALTNVLSRSADTMGIIAAAVVVAIVYATIALIVNETARALVWQVLALLAAVLMPVAVAFARVYRGFHHPTDVLFGVLLGCAALIVAVVAVRRRAPTTAPEEGR